MEDRAILIGGARAVIVPTTYLEPFGGVVVEAMLCGTPVISTDFGAFPEIVVEGFNGYRFRTLGEAVSGVEKCATLDRKKIQEWAQNNYSMERIRYLYQAYFEQLLTLWCKGFYTETSTEEYQRYMKK